VEADVGMIEQVVMNLAVNARDAMPNGGMLTLSTQEIEITEAAGRAQHEGHLGHFVCLSVTDTGCGMSQETLGRIFEPFYTTKEVGKGTGLGLATAYGIIKQHQGWIEVTSVQHVGTTFKVFIPISSSTEAVREKGEEQLSVRRGHNETILVVEDEPNLRAMALDSLKEHGYKVLQAAQGIEALDIYKAHNNGIDLVLTDIVMPGGMTGFELGQQIRAWRPDIKIIYTSGYSAEILNDAPADSNRTFLPKPYSLRQLSRVVRECLDK
jgi:CheY-like chemotaxis protein